MGELAFPDTVALPATVIDAAESVAVGVIVIEVVLKLTDEV